MISNLSYLLLLHVSVELISVLNLHYNQYTILYLLSFVIHRCNIYFEACVEANELDAIASVHGREPSFALVHGAADRIRTGDLLLGKETFYQLNYYRNFKCGHYTKSFK